MDQDFAHWGPLYVRWEAGLLEALGFGLDLTQCAATGVTGDLVMSRRVRTGGVGADAGADYAGRLLALPEFMLSSQNAPDLAGHPCRPRAHRSFSRRTVFAPQGRSLPPARLKLDFTGS